MSKLLPCPHCGETEHLYPAYHGLGGGEPYAIDCLGCGADYEPREGFDVIALWNRRTPDPAALQSRVTQLEEALRAVRKHVVVHRNDFGEVMNEDAEADLRLIDALLNGGSNERD